ncbi:lactoylglutathione lyase [Diplocarpon mali]|nr:lactoylglutathione lyase [Diplocarpon mali]
MAAATNLQSYKFNHSMCEWHITVGTPGHANIFLGFGSVVKFYEFLGMKMIRKIEQPEAKFDLYFLGYDSPKAVSHGNHFSDREGLIELTHNYGTENDPEYKVSTGNSEPNKGFGHTCISVDHIQAACQRIEDAGYKFQKKLTDGRMRSIAFALDPDGYWVEIIGQNPVDKTEGVKTTDLGTYRMNHTMIRIKDHEKSLNFYKQVFGMTLLRTSENKDANFNLYFLGYPGEKAVPTSSANGVNPIADREGLLELTWNYGTEKDAEFKYHNGNEKPQGFGHICVSVDDLDAACKRFEELGVNWKKRLTDGRMKTVAFILDPDDYWIEVIQNEKLKSRANW